LKDARLLSLHSSAILLSIPVATEAGEAYPCCEEQVDEWLG
jgi:hypothetical protein